MLRKSGVRLLRRAAAVVALALILCGCIGAALVSLYFSRVSMYAALSRPALSTDQILASLSTNITILGGLIAVATVVIGLAALFGYAELRTATLRKTEDDLMRMIQDLRESGDLSAATAAVLLQSVAPDRVVVVAGTTGASPLEQNNATKDVQSDDKLAEDYPGGDV